LARRHCPSIAFGREAMTPYANLAGDSGVDAFDIRRHGIDVRFRSGEVYRYTIASARASHIRTMKRLAQAGEGLSTFISQLASDLYEDKWSDDVPLR
jgi:hypothetical protein